MGYRFTYGTVTYPVDEQVARQAFDAIQGVAQGKSGTIRFDDEFGADTFLLITPGIPMTLSSDERLPME